MSKLARHIDTQALDRVTGRQSSNVHLKHALSHAEPIHFLIKDLTRALFSELYQGFCQTLELRC